jgi:hypothetical protein
MAKKTNEQKEFEKFYEANAPLYAKSVSSKYPWNHRYKNGSYSLAYTHVAFKCWQAAAQLERDRHKG